MIPRAELFAAAEDTGLLPTTVEKDVWGNPDPAFREEGEQVDFEIKPRAVDIKDASFRMFRADNGEEFAWPTGCPDGGSASRRRAVSAAPVPSLDLRNDGQRSILIVGEEETQQGGGAGRRRPRRRTQEGPRGSLRRQLGTGRNDAD